MDPQTLFEEINNRQYDGAVRVSAAHLVTTISVVGADETFPIAMLSVGMHKKGIKRFDALGGAIALGKHGLRLVDRFGVDEPAYDAHDNTYDARFVVPTKQQAAKAICWLGDIRNGDFSGFEYFETTPEREVFGELTGDELDGIPPACSADDPNWVAVRYDYYGVVIQPVPAAGGGTSVNSSSIPSARVFHGWNMEVTKAHFDTIVSAPQIRLLTPEECATTNGGSQKGMTADDIPLADNLGLNRFIRFIG